LPQKLFKVINNHINKEYVEAAASSGTTQLRGGLGFSVILKEDGSVWTFGRNDYGALGQNDLLDRSAPTRVPPAYFNNEKVVQIETSSTIVLARTETNKIYFWGNGQAVPSLIYNDLPVLDIEVAGSNDSNQNISIHIVTNDGLVRSTGNNITGAFGIGTNGNHAAIGDCTYLNDTSTYKDFTRYALKSATIEPCPSNTDFKRVKAGTAVPLDNINDISISPNNKKIMASTTNGELYVWGDKIGSIPIKLPGTDSYSIKKIEMSTYPTFLTTDGRLFYYPSNYGNPAEITLENSNSTVRDMESGDGTLLVIDSSNKLYGIGTNTFGQLGSLIPTSGVDFSAKTALYTGMENVQEVGAGATQTLIQYTNSNFSTIGKNGYGELATTDSNLKTTFVKNPYISNVKLISAQNYTSFAATTDNKFYGWGARDPKEVLYRPGATNTPNVIKDFSGISNIVDINGHSGYYIHEGILLENGDFWTFGENWKKGLGTNAAYYTLNGPIVNKNTNSTQTDFRLTAASQGSFHGTAISANNKVFTWGFDTYNLLGLGYSISETISGVSEPAGAYGFQEAITPDGEKFVKVYSGEYENILLTDTGKVYAWGAGISYKNRFGINQNPIVPTLLNSLPPIKEVAFGSHHNLFLDFSGNVWAAGDNSFGQLGLGNTTTPSIPTKIPTLSNIKAIGAGRSFSFAITELGQLYAFGDNRSGQLGLGDFIQRNEPRLVPGISNAKAVKAGRKHTLVLTDTGDIYVAGSDSDGQLGLAQSQVNSTPTPVVFPPTVTISSADNQILTVNDTLKVTGQVYTETKDVTMEIKYDIESKDGKTTNTLKTYTTTTDTEPFSLSLPLSSYSAGSYTLNVKAITSTGVTSQKAINFSVQDKINPTVSVDKTTAAKWALSPVTVKVTADDTGGSGYRGFRYSVSDSTIKPTMWSSIDPNKTDNVIINKSGIQYLHIEAYDNIGNVTYMRAGPYYMDIDPPDFVFTEPSKWQQDRLNLDVEINDASTIVNKKWLKGFATKDEVKNLGTSFTTNTISVTENGPYSFYAIDENNQESIKTYTVMNINYVPVLHSAPSVVLVPSTQKSDYVLSTTFAHYNDADSTQLVIGLNEKTITSKNTCDTYEDNKKEDWTVDFSSLDENTLYDGEIYLKDLRNGLSNKKLAKVEIYNPYFIVKSKLTGIKLSWDTSILADGYRVLRNGEVIYSGTNNSYFDNSVMKNTGYNYSLEVLVNGEYKEVAIVGKNSGYDIFETPNSISFPSFTIGDSSSIKANAIDLEYVKYEDLSDVNTPYSIRVSSTDFSSSSGSFVPESFTLKNVMKLNNTEMIEKTYPDIALTSTPVELITSLDTASNSYTKLEILKDNLQLIIPTSLKLSSSSTEAFTSTVIWDVTYAP